MAPRRKPRYKCAVGPCDRLTRRATNIYCNAHQMRFDRCGDVKADKPIEARTPRPPRAVPDPADPLDAGAADWLTTGQVAGLLGVHVSTIKTATENGLIPCRRTQAGHRRFDPVVVYPMAGQGVPKLPQVELYTAVCRVCGCSDEEACFGGCTWVAELTTDEGEICSRCAKVSTRVNGEAVKR